MTFDMTIEPSQEQRLALDLLDRGENVFLTGVAGTGKSWVIAKWLSQATDVAVTASTGIAATHIGGQTIHSWIGLGTKHEDAYTISQRQSWQQRCAQRIRRVQTLVIEEVSMLDAHHLDTIDRLTRYARGDPMKPFGGLQVVIIGDLGQLSPVELDRYGFVFDSEVWKTKPFTIIDLEEVFRQEDPTWVRSLNEIRVGKPSDQTLALLDLRVNAYDPELAEAVRLVTHNAQADSINADALRLISSQEHVYIADEGGLPFLLDQIDRTCLSPRRLSLKVGARVMATKNNPNGEWVNGSLGHVTELLQGHARVLFDGRARSVLVDQAEWGVREMAGEHPSAYRRQLPLRLAYAITVHKSQGMTLQRVSADLGNAFAPGQTYVALSRTRTIEGLNLERWGGRRSIFAHPRVVAMIEHGRQQKRKQ